MHISIIVAMSRDFIIGTGTGLPWHLPADLKRFRQLTTGKPVIMGRRTLEAIGHALPDRTNIVLSRRPGFRYPECLVAPSIEVAFALAADDLKSRHGDEAMVIGGTEVYSDAMPFTERLYLTVVEGTFPGGVSFPRAWVHDANWKVTHTESVPADPKNPYPHRFLILDTADEGGATIAGFAQSRYR